MADLTLPTIKPQKSDQPATLWQRIALGLSQIALLGNGNYDPQEMDLILPTLKPQKSDQPHTLLQRIAIAVAQIAANGGVTVGAKYKESFLLPGTLADETTFGLLKDDRDIRIDKVQLCCQAAPTGADVTVDLVDGDGAELGKISTLADGSEYQETEFSPAVTVAAGSVVRFKLKSVGSGSAGSNLTVTLLGAYTS